MCTVKLEDHTDTKKIGSLIGKKKGLDVRQAMELDKLDKHANKINFVIPESLHTLAPSFFLGMFSKSLAYFKDPKKFFEHYQFKASDFQKQQINDFVDDYFVASAEIEKLLKDN